MKMKKQEINEIETKLDLSYNEINEKTSASSCWMMGIFFLGLKRKAHHPREATLDIKNELPITKTDINCKMRVGADAIESAQENQNKLQNNKSNIMQKRVGAILIARKHQNILHTKYAKQLQTNVGAILIARKNKMQTLHSGITLISLVITIIILLILAGVTINLTLGENGIFGLAEKASKNYMDAQNKELAELDNIYSYIDNARLPENTPETDAGTVVKMPENWYSEIPAFYSAPEGKEVKSSQKIASVYGVSDGLGNTIPIPKEFYYVGGDIKTGIVISDNVKDKNKYAGKNGDGTAKEVEKDLAGNQFVWIPCEIEDYHKINWGQDNARWELETWLSRNNTNTKIWRLLYRKI